MSKNHFDRLPIIFATAISSFISKSRMHQSYDVINSAGSYIGSFSVARYKIYYEVIGYALEILSYVSVSPGSVDDDKMKMALQRICRMGIDKCTPCWIFLQWDSGSTWEDFVDVSAFSDALVFQSNLMNGTELWMDRCAGSVPC